MIGNGEFGVVHQGVWTGEMGEQVVIRQFGFTYKNLIYCHIHYLFHFENFSWLLFWYYKSLFC